MSFHVFSMNDMSHVVQCWRGIMTNNTYDTRAEKTELEFMIKGNLERGHLLLPFCVTSIE